MGDAFTGRLGDFEIGRELGRGGMGVVYEARQVSLNRRVALKVLGAGLGLTPRAVQRFHREAEAAARLHHTNIVPVYATGEQDGTHFYAMELVEGPSLDRVIKHLRHGEKSPPATADQADAAATDPYVPGSSATGEPAADALTSSSLNSDGHYFDTVARMVAEVADALDYAHKQGVIHRDIKPSNLLLSPDGRLSVNDFGLARLLEQPGMTMTGEFVGTPAYMSPEQIASGRILLDHRTDIYSLGATLYELLARQPPFAGERRDQVLAQILQKEPRAPRRINRKVPVDLETICLKAMDKDPDRRYQTAGQMAEDLRRYVNRFAIAARRAGPLRHLAKWVRRHPGLAAASGCAVIAIGLAGLLAYDARQARERHLQEQRELEEKLSAERRRSALDRALLAAMSGNFDQAEAAIGEAELLGAQTGQVRMLRGQIALHRGETRPALEHLELAAKLMPDSAAARALLSMACWEAGQTERAYQHLVALDRLPLATAEDYLFKGQMLGLLDPREGLALLDEAVRLRDSSVARLVRARVWNQQASATADPRDAEAALADVRVAQAMLPPGNPMVASECLGTHLVAAGVYEERGHTEKRDAALAQAAREAKALESVAAPFAFLARAFYFSYTGDDDAVLAEARRARQAGCAGPTDWCAVYVLARRGEFAKALEPLEASSAPGQEAMDHMIRAQILTQMPGARARALDAYQAACKTTSRGLGSLHLHSILLLLGDRAGAMRAFQQLRREGLEAPAVVAWYHRLLDYNCGLLTEAQLLEAAGDSRRNRCEAHYFRALHRLAEGDRDGAREALRESVATRVFGFVEYDLSRMLLATLDRDPNWPPWKTAKK